MSRITDQRYLDVQEWLAYTWREDRKVFSLISPSEQWLVHEYFVPSWSPTSDELLRYRTKVSKEQPSLAAAAARAASRMDKRLEAIQAQIPISKVGFERDCWEQSPHLALFRCQWHQTKLFLVKLCSFYGNKANPSLSAI